MKTCERGNVQRKTCLMKTSEHSGADDGGYRPLVGFILYMCSSGVLWGDM